MIAVVREGEVLYTPDPDYRFRPGDSVLLVGDEEAQTRARPYFLRPATPL